MRIWIGKEEEGTEHLGQLTIFVESSSLDIDNVRVIRAIVHKYRGQVLRLYLGAGRVDVTFVHYPSIDILLRACATYKVGVTLETASLSKWLGESIFLELIEPYDFSIVSRIDVTEGSCDVLPRISYKIDDTKVAYFTGFKAESITNISGVVDGMYPNDKLIYDDYKGEDKND